MYKVGCIVDAGVGGHVNDDRALINDSIIENGYFEKECDEVLAIVCDGVGGEAFGYEAANTIVTFFSKLNRIDINSNSIVYQLNEANCELLKVRQMDSQYSRMATTIAGLLLSGNNYLSFNIGDSRTYRFRFPYIAQLSTDHSLAAEMRELGLEIKPGQEHVITRSLGTEDHHPEVVDGTEKLFDQDEFIVCSDGISDAVTELDMEDIMKKDCPLREKCEAFIKMAVSKGSKDNLSIIVITRG